MGKYWNYNRNGGTIVVTIRDDSGRKIDEFNMNLEDKARCRVTFKIIQRKYGIKDFTDPVLEKLKEEKRDRDFFS